MCRSDQSFIRVSIELVEPRSLRLALKTRNRVAAQLYTIPETAKLSDVDAQAYLQIAVDAALDGKVIPLPHEYRDAVAARAAENIRAATERLTANA